MRCFLVGISLFLISSIFAQKDSSSKFHIIIPGLAFSYINFFESPEESNFAGDELIDHKALLTFWQLGFEYKIKPKFGVSLFSKIGTNRTNLKNVEDGIRSDFSGYDLQYFDFYGDEGTFKHSSTYIQAMLGFNYYQESKKLTLTHTFGLGRSKLRFNKFEVGYRLQNTNQLGLFRIPETSASNWDVNYQLSLGLKKNEKIQVIAGLSISRFTFNFEHHFKDNNGTTRSGIYSFHSSYLLPFIGLVIRNASTR